MHCTLRTCLAGQAAGTASRAPGASPSLSQVELPGAIAAVLGFGTARLSCLQGVSLTEMLRLLLSNQAPLSLQQLFPHRVTPRTVVFRDNRPKSICALRMVGEPPLTQAPAAVTSPHFQIRTKPSIRHNLCHFSCDKDGAGSMLLWR